MIRNLRKNDSERITQLLDISGGMDALQKHLDVITKYNHLHLFGFEKNGSIIGMATIAKIDDLSHNRRPFAVLETIIVDEKFRGRGIGTSLVQHAIEQAKTWDAYKLIVETGTQQEWKLSFYEKCGFTRGEKTAFIKRFDI